VAKRINTESLILVVLFYLTNAKKSIQLW